jgi:hypothetical protein
VKTAADAHEALAPKRGKRPDADRFLSKEDWLDRQKVRGDFSGIQGRCSSLLPLHNPSFVYGDDYNSRRKVARARYNLIWCVGMVVDAERDDGDKQQLIWNNGNWFLSMLVFVKRYARKALFWNRGNMGDADLPDFYAMGLKAMGLTGSESLEEIKEAARRFIWRCRQPKMTSNLPSEVACEVLEDQEIQPCLKQKARQYVLSWAEYAAVKRFVRPSQVRLAAGRLAGYKKRGDLDGFVDTLHQISEGKRLTVGGNRAGVNAKKRKLGGYVSMVMTKALVGASCALESASRVTQFMVTGEI